MAEKIKYGLSNVHYAVLTDEDNLTYDKPKPIKGAVNLSLSPEGDSSTFYADNIAYFVTTLNNGFSGDLEMALIPDEFLIDVMGYHKDEETGLLVELASALPKTIALLFQFENDTNSRRVAMYNVIVGRPGTDHSTKTETLEPQTDTLPITVTPVQIGEHTVTKATANKQDSSYSTFYDEVVLPSLEVVDIPEVEDPIIMPEA